MALDETILEAVSEGHAPPTLRLYRWHPPCLSLGHAQPISDVDQGRLDTLGWDLVRRPTGGRAILHTDELTYSIIGLEADPLFVGGVLESYKQISQALLHALKELGLQVEVHPDSIQPEDQRENPICFQVPSVYEITASGKKIIGSAQLRRKKTILQHGSIPLKGDITRICEVLSFRNEKSRNQAFESLRKQAGTIGGLLGSEISWEQAADTLVDGFTQALGMQLTLGEITPSELERAELIFTQRYHNPEWTNRL